MKIFPAAFRLFAGAMMVAAQGSDLAPTNGLDPSAQAASPPKAYFGRLPLSFEANRGQWPAEDKFRSRGSRFNLAFTEQEVRIELAALEEERTVHGGKSASGNVGQDHLAISGMRLLGWHPAGQVAGLDELPGKVNYFQGHDPARWRANLPTFAKVRYASIFPGIDLVFYGDHRQLEYDFILAPGADPALIQLALTGADWVEINAPGDLIAHLGKRQLCWRKPITYQVVNGALQVIPARYRLNPAQEYPISPLTPTSQEPPRHPAQFGFQVAAYDRSRPLIIDPVLVYSTYWGGGGDDQIYAIAVDGAGSAYFAGLTSSTNLATINQVQKANGGGLDAFVAKLNAAGNALIYLTYLGGSDDDWANSLAVDAAGNAYIAGQTRSPDFPTKNAMQTRYGGGTANGSGDGFVAKLSAAGNALVYSTYLGGNLDDTAYGIMVDSQGNAIVAGNTGSTNFPTQNPLQAAFGGGGSDLFITKFNASGSNLLFSTYLGGNDWDGLPVIALDTAGNVYLSGTIYSTNFPTKSPFQAVSGSGGSYSDAFVTKLKSDGSTLIYSSYLGGNGDDLGAGIAVDAVGNAWITGATVSASMATTNAFQTNPGYGSADAFVAKVNAAGSGLVFLTYLGGKGLDYGLGIAVDGQGTGLVTGLTDSPDFPVINPFQGGIAGTNQNAFVARVGADGSQLLYSSYLGGSGGNGAYGVAVDGQGNAYVAGRTWSFDFPLAGSLPSSYAGGDWDGFVAKASNALTQPSLQINRTGGNWALTWPTNQTAFFLEAADRFGSPGQWQAWPDKPQVAGTRNSILLPALSGNTFFRLRSN